MNYDAMIIGGGVAGLSTAMQLSMRGARVVVVERQQLGSGSTGRAAGNLEQLRSTAAQTRFQMDAVRIIRELEQRTGSELFIQSGSIRLAETAQRVEELQNVAAMGSSLGLEVHEMSPESVAEIVPYMRTDDILAACHFPTDGHVKPAELTKAYVDIGREHGVQFKTNCTVERILYERNRVHGVDTSHGRFSAPVVINAAGPWSYLIAQQTGTPLPTAAFRHAYLVTRPDPERPIDRLGPVVRDRQHRIYARPESGGLLVGMYEERPIQYAMDELPGDFDMSSMKAARDDERIALLIEAAGRRFPWIDSRTPMHVTTGIMTFTPDSQPLCGRLPDYEGLYYCCGMSGRGIVQSPTIGRIMAELILDGETSYDIESISADRYFDEPGYQDREKIEQACRQMYATIYGGIEQVETATVH